MRNIQLTGNGAFIASGGIGPAEFQPRTFHAARSTPRIRHAAQENMLAPFRDPRIR